MSDFSAVLPIYNRKQPSFAKGEGAYLYTDNGDKYLDFLSGIAVNALGHCHPHLVNTLTEQGSKLWHTSNVFAIDNATKLAERLCEATFADSVFFCNSGTEAIEAAVKITRRYFDYIGQPDKHKIITFDGAFHGRSTAAIAATGTAKALEGFEPRLQGFDKVKVENGIAAVEGAIDDKTAAILVEPIQGEGGIRPMPDGFLSDLRALCDKHGLLLILDEIQCGISRTGKFLAHEYCNVIPDICTIAKGIGGGFPLGATLVTAQVGECMTLGTHGTTFGGNPLATAVGNAVLDIVLADGFDSKVKQTGNLLKQRLEGLQQKYPSIIDEIRGCGLMLGIKIKDSYTNIDLINKLFDRKLIVNAAGSNVVRILPPLVIDESHINEACDIIDEALEEL